MDCRPREPLQLAGEDGSSKHGEECFDAGELAGERLFDADADSVRPGEAFDDSGDADCASADVCFKPNCLGIGLSVSEYPCNAERRSKIQTEYVLTPHSRAHSIGAYR
jgi:hypothetical protein